MRRLVIPLVFAATAVVATFVVDIGQGEAFEGTPDWDRVMTTEQGEEVVYVEWVDEGATRSDFVAAPAGAEGVDTLPLRVEDDEATLDGITWPVYVVVAAIALLLGLVVDYSVRGYGYVRGTGRVSETPDLDVSEDRGFYWRF